MSGKTFTLCSPSVAEIVEKKSRFIGIIERVTSEEEALSVIERERKANRDARHVCFAYHIGGGRVVRASDDGEPSGTAGVPILELIKKTGLDDVVIVVIRYFGGILLGAPGLVRAYSSAAKEALNSAMLGEYVSTACCSVRCDYKEYDRVKYLLEQKGAFLISPEFAEDIRVDFKLDQASSAVVLNDINEIFGGKLKPEIVTVIDEIKPV